MEWPQTCMHQTRQDQREGGSTGYILLSCSPFFLYLPASSFTLTSWDDKSNATQRCCWRKKIISACYIALLSGAVKLSERMKANQFGSCCEAPNNVIYKAERTLFNEHCSCTYCVYYTLYIIAVKFLHWLRAPGATWDGSSALQPFNCSTSTIFFYWPALFAPFNSTSGSPALQPFIADLPVLVGTSGYQN